MTTVANPAVPSTAACAECGRTTIAPELLHNLPGSRSHPGAKNQLFCPRCTAHRQYRNLVGFYAIIVPVIITLVLLALLSTGTTDIARALRIFLIPFALLLLSAKLVMLVCHETAHALVGWAVGLRVFGVSLGSGPRIVHFCFRRFFLDLHWLPAGGACWTDRPSSTTPLRWALMVAAGPFVHLLGIVIPVLMNRSVDPARWHEMPFSMAFFWINAYMLVVNFVPRTGQRGASRIPTDGRRLCNILLRRKESSQLPSSAFVMDIRLCLETARFTEAARLLEQARPTASADANFQITELGVLGVHGKWNEVRAKADQCRAVATTPDVRAAFATWAAVARVYDHADLSEAETLVNEAASVMPWSPAVQTAQATVLLARGRDNEARAALESAGSVDDGWAANAARARAWEELWRRQDNPPRLRRWHARASALDPTGIFRIPSRADGPAESNRSLQSTVH